MKELITIEWMKLRRMMTLKVILIIYAIVVPTIYLCLSLIEIPMAQGPQGEMISWSFPTSAFEFPSSYHFATYVSSWFNLMVGVILIVFTCNELKYKTQRQNVIDGLSKRDVILSKFYVVFLFSAAITLYTFLIGFVVGLFNSGFSDVFDGIEHVGVYFVSTLGYFTFAFFFANLVKSPALAIIFYILSTFLEGIIGFIAVQKYVQFFPLSTFSDLVTFPLSILPEPPPDPYIWSTPERTALAAVYIFIFVAISYFVIKRRDI